MKWGNPFIQGLFLIFWAALLLINSVVITAWILTGLITWFILLVLRLLASALESQDRMSFNTVLTSLNEAALYGPGYLIVLAIKNNKKSNKS